MAQGGGQDYSTGMSSSGVAGCLRQCPICTTDASLVYHLGDKCPREGLKKKVHAVEFYPNGKIQRIEFVDGDVDYADMDSFIAGLVEVMDVALTVGGEGKPRFARMNSGRGEGNEATIEVEDI